jgi:hypothetical protein
MSAPEEVPLLSQFTYKRTSKTKQHSGSLIKFIETILPSLNIQSLHFKRSEYYKQRIVQYPSHFDVFVELNDGRFLIVEVPKEIPPLSTNLSIYHSYQPVKNQGKRGVWNYEQYPVYIISILNERQSRMGTTLIHCTRLIN